MDAKLTIGRVARQSGMSVPTIRFYEAQGIIPAPERTEAGYRLYSTNDVRRLHLARRARLLGLSLPEVKSLVHRAFASDCGAYAHEILRLVATQRERIDNRSPSCRRIAPSSTSSSRRLAWWRPTCPRA